MKAIRTVGSAVMGLICFLAFMASVYAHGPQTVELKYSGSPPSLTVTVTHTPFHGDRHFINELAIMKNGRSVGIYPLKDQTEGTFTRTYPLSVMPGDVLEVKATCNRYGSRTGKITVDR